MAVLNLRDVPDDLAHALRVEAAQAEMGIKDYCVAIFESRKKIADDSAGVVGENPACPPSGKRELPDNIQPLPDKQAALVKLRGMVAGIENNVLIPPTRGADGNFEAPEVDLCGCQSYNEVDGENYICCMEKHGPKVKHGDWLKV